MNLRRLLLVFLVIVVVLTASFFFLNFDESVNYNRINLTTSSNIEVPMSDESRNTVIEGGINLYNDTKHDLSLMYFNSVEGSQVSAIEFEYIRNNFAGNSVEETLANQTIWHNKENDTYMAFIGNYATHDNILIVSKDPEILAHVMTSARYQYFNEATNSTETYIGENQSLNALNDAGVDNTGVDYTGVDNTGVDYTGVDNTGVANVGVDTTGTN